ncbi:hypothetical protein F4775DRAFT_575580 [Biscogniauxia sp. FL1348]|nr:hypothetical protein F4775DRAFT_575580 [Biscogniauxia sp. FL1348]
MASNESDYDEYDDIPLQDKRPFGSGLKRKRVVFVPASSGPLNTTEENTTTKPSKSVSDLYLSIVLPGETGANVARNEADKDAPKICEVCSLPMNENPGTIDMRETERKATTSRPHEASIAHQVCMTHSHPPSAVDRSRMGLGVLQSQGWDPDSRRGLGASQQGMQHPIKVTPKNDTLGIGVKVPKNLPVKKEKVQKLDAKKARKMAEEDRRRHERLRHQFYGNSEVEKYLGHG